MAKTISEQTPGDNDLAADALSVFETDNKMFQARHSAVSEGLTFVAVHKLDDLPPLVSGFRRLEQDKHYHIVNAIFIPDKILIPAGWNGHISSSHVPRNSLIYIGAETLLNTLHLNGIIDSIANSITNPGVKSTVTTSASHGLVDGDYVNIRDTLIETAYTQPRLLVSNVTASTFDVDIVFTNTDIGTFNTGVLGSLFFPMCGFVDSGFGTLFDLDFTTDPLAQFSSENLSVFNFKSLGIIRKCAACAIGRSSFTFLESGIIFEDCDTVGINSAGFINLNPFNTTAKCITIQGALTKDVVITNSKLKTANPAQFPVRLDPTIINAKIDIINTPDNDVSTEYFDTSSGGLDEKNPQVNTRNNGSRKNSQTVGSAFVNGNTVVTTIVSPDVFQDINFGVLLASVNMERFILSNSANGEFTYIGLKPMSDNLVMNITVRKTGGATATYEIKFIKDTGSGFVDLDDPVIVPVEIKTSNDNSSYLSKLNLKTGDKVKPQIQGVGNSDSVIVESASVIM